VERTFPAPGGRVRLVGVLLGAFGSHALRSKLTPERVATFETGVRYQLWHALALFAVVLVEMLRFPADAPGHQYPMVLDDSSFWPRWLAGWLFVAGIVLFSGSLYVLSLTGRRAWGAVTPFGGVCLVLGWAALLIAIVAK
jgi:uncharacterized membrane protein YgdD (TMEM256/DUF423 family)